MLFDEFDLGAEPRGAKAHFDGSFAHSVKGIAAGLGWGAFVNEVAEDGCGGEDGEIDVVKRLVPFSQGSVATKVGMRVLPDGCEQ